MIFSQKSQVNRAYRFVLGLYYNTRNGGIQMVRKRDEHKNRFVGKAAKTISFDKIILEKIEVRAEKEGTDVSKLVNRVCRRAFLTDVDFHTVMARYYNSKMQEHLFMKQESLAIREVKQ